MTDRIDPIAAARALIAAQPDLLFRCDLCPVECDCHPHHDMSMSGGNILCDGCADFEAAATLPDPLKLIATLADALEAERAKVAAAYEAAAQWHEETAAHDQGGVDYSDAVGVTISNRYELEQSVKAHTYSAYAIRALTPADAQAALDKMLAEARLEGWRAGLEAMRKTAAETAFGWPSTHDTAMVHLSNAIRALPEPKETSHD